MSVHVRLFSDLVIIPFYVRCQSAFLPDLNLNNNIDILKAAYKERTL